ncbi:MAG: putative glycine dehydrogenase (decarboxylating) subunit 1 [Deltaproteobacteria bacterium ADurb.Bin510]|nr:MAG: putative glycine dehydrogenase (decarboxylating) subunit 1 [Deltaproteobacteria bacterium ADurb.Bin510]
MEYTALSQGEVQRMLAGLGLSSESALFECIPEELRLKRELELPAGLDEESLRRKLKAPVAASGFAGGGFYRHHIPAVVDALSSRQEFYTAYTPYQPEISQGTLQAIFEFQSMLSDLTGMDACNASMYDGATALAEAALLAVRRKKVGRVVVTRATNPAWRRVLKTYLQHTEGVELIEAPFDSATGRTDLEKLAGLLDSKTALFVQQPNYFGVVEDMAAVAEQAKQAAFFGITVNEAVSLGLLEKPGSFGPDVVVGEAQSFGNPVAAGGPLLGFFCASSENLRHMPGRLVGETTDATGRRAFCLTLATREQHIRREKATSNICSNQGLCALRAAIYLSAMGPRGLRATAVQCASGARHLQALMKSKGLQPLFSAPVFNEFVIRADAAQLEKLRSSGLLPGVTISPDYPELADALLVTVTELNTPEECECLLKNL